MIAAPLPLARRAACLGGGTGIVAVARGLLEHGMEVTAVVATTDNGRSSGLARRLFDIPAPGDIRNVISAFATEVSIRDAFEYRLTTPTLPELTGAAFGNLVLGVLTKTSGSFEEAVTIAARIAGTRITVEPVTAVSADLCAELADGSVVRGEVDVRRPGKPPIRRVFLDPPAAATESALRAIREAELVTLGPGSLFTSVLACLAVNGIPEALAASTGQRVYIANTTTQPGQSDDVPLAAQIDLLLSATGNAIDAVLVDESEPDAAVVARHRAAGRELLRLSPLERETFEARGLRIVSADVAERGAPPRTLWQKEDAIRHDAARVGAVLARLLTEQSA
ncbi:MAG: putative gluconeogenesis factor [Dehalococcoidia bacterium]|nr:MAG: putative gluconeogenesis factor [Dehalococcoidia bacterium]